MTRAIVHNLYDYLIKNEKPSVRYCAGSRATTSCLVVAARASPVPPLAAPLVTPSQNP